MQELSVDSINNQLHSYLKAKARGLANPARALVFKIDNKNTFKIVDADKRSFQVEEFFLQSFRQTFSDKSYKYIKIMNWEFEIELSDAKAQKISLNADTIVFIANKNTKKQFKDIAFRAIAVSPDQIEKLPKQVKGFARRIIKKHILSYSENVNTQFYSLITFVKRSNENLKIERMTNVAEEQIIEEHPMEYLTPQGRKIIQKLRAHISRQDVFDFVVRQQLSSSTQSHLRNIILSTAQIEGKKKKVKAE